MYVFWLIELSGCGFFCFVCDPRVFLFLCKLLTIDCLFVVDSLVGKYIISAAIGTSAQPYIGAVDRITMD